MFFATIPFIMPPQIQFGIRIGSEDTESRSIKYMKYEYAILEIAGISLIIPILTNVFGLNLDVESVGIGIFIAFTWIIYGIFRIRVRNIKKISENHENNRLLNAVIIDEGVKVKKMDRGCSMDGTPNPLHHGILF